MTKPTDPAAAIEREIARQVELFDDVGMKPNDVGINFARAVATILLEATRPTSTEPIAAIEQPSDIYAGRAYEVLLTNHCLSAGHCTIFELFGQEIITKTESQFLRTEPEASKTFARAAIMKALMALSRAATRPTSTDQRSEAVERHSEALYALSAHLKRLGVLGDDAAHAAYEAVVASFTALATLSPDPDVVEALRARIAEKDRILKWTQGAIMSGCSEPLFIARDEIVRHFDDETAALASHEQPVDEFGASMAENIRQHSEAMERNPTDGGNDA